MAKIASVNRSCRRDRAVPQVGQEGDDDRGDDDDNDEAINLWIFIFLKGVILSGFVWWWAIHKYV